MSRLEISRAGIELIASFEGYRAKAARLETGRYTVGYGHIATAREGMAVTREQAEELLRWDLGPIEDYIRQNCLTVLTQNQFDAIVSFTFNIGLEAFKNSEVLRHLNRGEPVAAAIAINAWRRAHINGQQIVVDALVRRRMIESAMFLETIGPRPAAPSPIITPVLDYSASLLAPKADNIKAIGFENQSTAPMIMDKKIIEAKNTEVLEQVEANKTFDKLAEKTPKTIEETNEITLTPFPENLDDAYQELNKSNNENIIFPENIANDIIKEEKIEIAPIAANDTVKMATKPKFKPVIAKAFKARRNFEPMFLLAIFGGLLALVSGIYEAIGQDMFANGFKSFGTSNNHVFVLLTIVIGAFLTLYGIVATFFNTKE